MSTEFSIFTEDVVCRKNPLPSKRQQQEKVIYGTVSRLGNKDNDVDEETDDEEIQVRCVTFFFSFSFQKKTKFFFLFFIFFFR